MPTWYKPLLEDKERFPDSSFSASSSTEGHSPSDARISSASSWCAPVADGKYYLQVDLGRVYLIDAIVTYGDSSSLRWVSEYQLNYTIDLLNWRTSTRVRVNSYHPTRFSCSHIHVFFFFRQEINMLTIKLPSGIYILMQDFYDSFH